jgi:hypothetical protein
MIEIRLTLNPTARKTAQKMPEASPQSFFFALHAHR